MAWTRWQIVIEPISLSRSVEASTLVQQRKRNVMSSHPITSIIYYRLRYCFFLLKSINDNVLSLRVYTPLLCPASQVYVAKWVSVQRAHEFLNHLGLYIQPIHLDNVLERSFRAVGLECSDIARNSARLVKMQSLPDPPHTVYHRMVQIEDRVIGTAVEVTTVSAHYKVASGVHA
jgi:hypothetical protein